MDPVRALAHVHGHLGWLVVAILLHPALILRGGRTPLPLLTPALATGLVTAQAALGAYLYTAYRERLKQQIFQTDPRIGWLFERKEHLAFGLLVVVWIALVACLVARTQPEGPVRSRLVATGARAYGIGAALAFATALFGTIVAIHRSL